MALHERPSGQVSFIYPIQQEIINSRPKILHIPLLEVQPDHQSATNVSVSAQIDKPDLLPRTFVEQIIQLPQGTEEFNRALKSYKWIFIDSCKLPALIRNNEEFIAKSMVEMKLLASFPANIPKYMLNMHKMPSVKMTLLESWILSTINTIECNFDFGYHMFSTADELVKLQEVEKFYWATKAYSLGKVSDCLFSGVKVTAMLHKEFCHHLVSLNIQANEEFRALGISGEKIVPTEVESQRKNETEIQNSKQPRTIERPMIQQQLHEVVTSVENVQNNSLGDCVTEVV